MSINANAGDEIEINTGLDLDNLPETIAVRYRITENLAAGGETLADGGVSPQSWALFDESTYALQNPSGELDSANEGTSEYTRLYARPVANFINDVIEEHTGSERTVRVLAHPFNGIDGSGNKVGVEKVEFFLNGGSATTITVPSSYTCPVTGFVEETWECTVPASLSQELNEVRAVVYPRIGRVRVLQGSGWKTDADYETEFGVRRKDNKGTPKVRGDVIDWGPGQRVKERGTFFQVPSNKVFYISPTGDDTTGDGSQGNPWQTPGKVYDAQDSGAYQDTNFTIDNSAYSSPEVALYFQDYFTSFDLEPGVDAKGYHPVPMLKGGVVIGLPKSSSGGTSVPNPSGSSNPANLGLFMSGVNVRTQSASYAGSDSRAAAAFNLDGNGQKDKNSLARYIIKSADVGFSANWEAELEAQVEAPTGSTTSTYGIYLEMKGTGTVSPVFVYDSVVRYSHFKDCAELMRTKFVGVNGSDPGNSQILHDVHMKGVCPWIFPIGPVGDTFCEEGGFDSYVAPRESDYDTVAIQGAIDDFYELMGTNGVPDLDVIEADDPVWVLKDLSAMPSAKATALQNAWAAIGDRLDSTGADKTYVPCAVMSTAKGTLEPKQKRNNIDISTIDSWFSNGTNLTGAWDPHVDMQQSYWESTFREPTNGAADYSTTYGVYGPAPDKSWLSGTIACCFKVEGTANKFQGIFHSDGGAVIESGFWNLDWQRGSLNDSNLLQPQQGYAGQGYGGPGNQFGPNLRNNNADIAGLVFNLGASSAKSGAGGWTFYEDANTPFQSNGNKGIPDVFDNIAGTQWPSAAVNGMYAMTFTTEDLMEADPADNVVPSPEAPKQISQWVYKYNY